MRNSIIILIFILACGRPIKAQTRYKLDEIVWQDKSSSWVNSYKESYQYNQYGNKTEQTYYEWNTAWIALERSVYEYNAQQLLSKSTLQVFVNQQWTDSSETVYSYDQNNHLAELITRSKGLGTNDWRNDVKETYVSDKDGNVTASATYEWSDAIQDWQGIARDFHTFDEDGLMMASNSDTWDDLLEIWVPFDRETYTYQNNGDITLSTYQRWDEFAEVWTNSFNDYTELYQENGIPKLRYLSQVWNEVKNDWEYHSKEFHTLRADDRLIDYTEYDYNSTLRRWDYYDMEEYTYSDHDDLTTYTDYDRDEPYNRWIENTKENVSYTTSISGDNLILPFEGADLDIYFNSRMDEIILSDWNSRQKRWEQTQKGVFNYSVFDPVGVQKVDLLNVSIYPNPATDYLVVELPENFKGTLKLLNLSGTILLNQLIESSTNIPISEYAKGLYILQIKTDVGLSYQKKIIFE